MDKFLRFTMHATRTTAKAGKAHRFQTRFLNAKTKTKTQLFKALTLPHLLHSPLLSLLSSRRTQYISQIVQNKSLRLITKVDRHTTNKNLHRRLKIPPVNYHNWIRLHKLRDKLTEDPLCQQINALNERRPRRFKHKLPTSDSLDDRHHSPP